MPTRVDDLKRLALAALIVTVAALPGTVRAQSTQHTEVRMQPAVAVTDGVLQRGAGGNTDPALSSGEATYLDATGPHRQRLAGLFTALEDYQRIADAGQLGQIDGNALLALDYQFSAAQQAFNSPSPSPRFDRYVETARQATQQGHDAASLLLRAQHAASDGERSGPIGQARPLVSDGRRFQRDADSMLNAIVPAATAP